MDNVNYVPWQKGDANNTANDGKVSKDAADQNFDYMFKLLIIGNSSVGKTSFLFRYADNSYTSAFVSTVGIDFKVKTVFRQDKRVKLQIWVRDFFKSDEVFLSFWCCSSAVVIGSTYLGLVNWVFLFFVLFRFTGLSVFCLGFAFFGFSLCFLFCIVSVFFIVRVLSSISLFKSFLCFLFVLHCCSFLCCQVFVFGVTLFRASFYWVMSR